LLSGILDLSESYFVNGRANIDSIAATNIKPIVLEASKVVADFACRQW
jgi:hypothetical protein